MLAHTPSVSIILSNLLTWHEVLENFVVLINVSDENLEIEVDRRTKQLKSQALVGVA